MLLYTYYLEKNKNKLDEARGETEHGVTFLLFLNIGNN